MTPENLSKNIEFTTFPGPGGEIVLKGVLAVEESVRIGPKQLMSDGLVLAAKRALVQKILHRLFESRFREIVDTIIELGSMPWVGPEAQALLKKLATLAKEVPPKDYVPSEGRKLMIEMYERLLRYEGRRDFGPEFLMGRARDYIQHELK